MEKTKNMCSFGTEEHGLQTGTVKVSELHAFKGHPFKVENDIQLFELMRSIEDKGVLVPLIVRSNPYGDGYEIIAGHRRKAACEWAGIDEVPVIVREMDDADAVIAMIDSNLQREHIKPSEKAFAYKMKLEAMKSQGKRTDLTASQVGTKLEKRQTEDGKTILRADERLAKEVGESRNQIARYIRLTNLIPKILDMVDEGKIAFTIGVELSYLSKEEQYELHAVMDLEECTPSLSQANRLKRMSQTDTLDMDEMYRILEQEKPNQREQIKIRADTLAEYFPKDFTPRQKVDDYETWDEQPSDEVSVYQAFDEFMEKANVPENDTDVFYGGVFHDFHKEWQGVAEEPEKEEEIDYTKLSMKERAELLPPPTDDTMEEFEQYKTRMGYGEEKMRTVRYKMEVYDDFLKEYDYRKKIKGMQEPEKREKKIKKDREYGLVSRFSTKQQRNCR